MTSSRMRTLVTTVAATAVAVLALSACSGGGGGATASGARESITVGVQRGPNSFDPLLSVWGGQYQMFLSPVYATLIRQDTDGGYSAGLATEWGFTDDEQKTFELTLRDDATFADGSPVDADAVKANLDRLESVVGPQTAELSSTLESVEVVDEDTIDIHLSSQNPEIERILSQLSGMIVNPAALDDPDALATTPDGAGPYVLDVADTIVNDTYVYTKNENYYDPDEYPYETVTMKVYGDPNAMLTALQSGVAQLGYGAPDTVETAEGAGLGVVTQPTNVFHLVLQDRDGVVSPELADVRVRQALNYAVDRQAILDSVYRGQGVVTDQIFGPNTEGYDPDLDDYYPYDPEKAEDLLAEAGYADGFTFSAAIPVATRDTDYAQALAGYFAEIGVTMELTPLTGTTADADTLGTYAAWTNGFGGQGTFGDAKTLFLTPGTTFNALGTTDDELTRLWEEGSRSTDEAERTELYQQLSAAVTELAWFVPTTAVNAIAYYDVDAFDSVEFTPGITVPMFYELASK